MKRIETTIELLILLLNQALGGRSGVIRGADSDDLKAEALSTPGLSVVVAPGYAFINSSLFKLAVSTETVDVTAPTTNDRIDLVQASLETWTVNILKGTEAATPSAPSAETDCIALAQLYLRPAMASIKNADDSTNGYIIDARTFL